MRTAGGEFCSDRDGRRERCGNAAENLEYPKETRKTDAEYRCMDRIQAMAVTGKSVIEAMGTRMPMPGWDDILILGAQLNPPPLMEHDRWLPLPSSERTPSGP